MTSKNVSANEPTGNPVPIGEVMRDIISDRDMAEHLLRIPHSVAVELHQMGVRLGVILGEWQAGERAEKAAAAFLDYLGDCPEVPDLDHGPATGPEDAS